MVTIIIPEEPIIIARVVGQDALEQNSTRSDMLSWYSIPTVMIVLIIRPKNAFFLPNTFQCKLCFCMSKPPTTDWSARALEAMEQQQLAAAHDASCQAEPETENVGLLRLLGGIAQLMFLTALGYFLVQRYGILHLVWIGLVTWYLVIPSMTNRNKTAYR
jgi:hypothetical protein